MVEGLGLAKQSFLGGAVDGQDEVEVTKRCVELVSFETSKCAVESDSKSFFGRGGGF